MKKTVKSPPEKFSYPHLIRVWALVLLFAFLFAFVFFVFAVCANSTDPTDFTEPRIEIETGTTQKFYNLREPVSQLENIDCDLRYEYLGGFNEPHWTFGTQTVDIWRTYKLEERQNGAFRIDFSTSLAFIPSNHLEWYEYSASINYNNLQDEKLICTLCTEVNRDTNTRNDFKRAWDGLDSTYYCTWVVDGFQTKHRIDYNGQLDRIWNIRLYILFVDSETTVTLHEYIFHQDYHCCHDENGNEVWDRDSSDKWIYDRYVSQSYSPPI